MLNCQNHNPWPDGKCEICQSYRVLFGFLAGDDRDLFEEVRFVQVCGFWVRDD